MRTTQASRLTKLHAVRDFLDEHADHLKVVNASNARRRLDTLLEELGDHASEQEGSRIGGLGETQRYRLLRRELVEKHIAPVVAVAQSTLVDDPELKVFRMPRGNPSTGKLSAFATGLAVAAARREAAFIAAGLEADFIEQLRAAAAAMLASDVERRQQVGRRSSATTGLHTEIRSALTVVRVLGILVRKETAGNVALLSSWNTIAPTRRITTSASRTALPAPARAAALSAPKAKLLASGPTSPEDPPSAREHGTLATFLEPLSRLIPRKGPTV